MGGREKPALFLFLKSKFIKLKLFLEELFVPVALLLLRFIVKTRKEDVMAIQTTMGHRTDVHFSKRAMYWTLGIIVALFIAIGLAMSRNNVTTVSDRTSVQDTRSTASDSNVNGSADSGGFQRASPAGDANPARSE